MKFYRGFWIDEADEVFIATHTKGERICTAQSEDVVKRMIDTFWRKKRGETNGKERKKTEAQNFRMQW